MILLGILPVGSVSMMSGGGLASPVGFAALAFGVIGLYMTFAKESRKQAAVFRTSLRRTIHQVKGVRLGSNRSTDGRSCGSVPLSKPLAKELAAYQQVIFLGYNRISPESSRKSQKPPETKWFQAVRLELLSRFELETSSLPRMRSTD